MSNKKTILLVEDEEAFAQMMKIRLELAGYSVKIANDTASGVKAILEMDVDLIVLDLMMPGGGGFSVLQQIKRDNKKSKIPVIVVTGKTIDSEVKTMIGAFQVAALFTKPYDAIEFLETIKSLVTS